MASSPPPQPPAQTQLAVELVDIHKYFGPVTANAGVDLAVAAHTIHGIVGENGAGKSTLMAILYGYHAPDRGTVGLFGQTVRFKSPKDAIAAGVGMVHQHFMLVDTLTVVENAVLGQGRGSLRRALGQARRQLRALADELGLAVDPDAVVGQLSVGQRQRVEILKALYRSARLLILDEPTAVLTPQETDQLFAVLATLKDKGVTVLLITHKLKEIMAVTDRVSVIRQGRMVAHYPTTATDPTTLAQAMVGRPVAFQLERKAPAPPRGDTPPLVVAGVSVAREGGGLAVEDVSFQVNQSEIVGIAGVAGNGQSELLEALAGMRPLAAGEVVINGQHLTPHTPWDGQKLRRAHAAHIPEDRLQAGLVPAFAAAESALLGYQDEARYNGLVLLHRDQVAADCRLQMEQFDTRPRNPQLRTALFSGGNQQKLVLARELQRRPAVLLVGQPTRGVDIGAVEIIHRQLLALRDRGTAILLVSVELDEIKALCDRILVMCAGTLQGELAAANFDEAKLGLMMAGARSSPSGAEEAT
ncbi:MAG: ABC transporter ATP-binding protein [Candidatus Competibacterales bacterium]